jgi:hypothetical protein
MAINFSNKVLVTNPTSYHLGRAICFAGIAAVIFGLVTLYTGDFLFPAKAWCAFGVPIAVIGIFFARSGLTKP